MRSVENSSLNLILVLGNNFGLLMKSKEGIINGKPCWRYCKGCTSE